MHKRVIKEETKINNVAVGVKSDEISVGDFVWAKVKGYNWWPAEVSHTQALSDLSCSKNQIYRY